MSNQQQQIPLEAPAHALQNMMVQYDQEGFRLVLMSGGPARMYVLSPKHAKRIMLLLEKQINEYESKFGELETTLPEAQGSTESEGLGFKTE